MESIEDYLTSQTPRNKRKTAIIQSLGYKHDYPILEYQEKFKSSYQQMKTSLITINTNITNYKNEIEKLEESLIRINEHEKNYKRISKKFQGLKTILEEAIDKENLISKLSFNQQIINISEYVNLYQKVKEIIVYFQSSQLTDSLDFAEKMRTVMYSGFKVYEESFYTILKRYEQIKDSPDIETEKMNLLNKIELLADCLQDVDIKYDFTLKLVETRKDNIVIVLDDIKINMGKNASENNYHKNSGTITNMLIKAQELFRKERDYIFRILKPCNSDLKNEVYLRIIRPGFEKITQNLKDLISRHSKSSSRKVEFYQNFDIIDLWHEGISYEYSDLVEKYDETSFKMLVSLIHHIEEFCFVYVNNFLNEIQVFNEKIENENVLQICNDAFFFLSTLLNFEKAFLFIKRKFQSSGNRFTVEMVISILVGKMEDKSAILMKKFPPLKFIFLINNVFFIQSKIIQKPFTKFIEEDYAETLTSKINGYIENYVTISWKKVDESVFNEKENPLFYEQDGKSLKSSSREVVKKRFANFNETMKLNLRFQQNIQIIDNTLEAKLIDANINYISNRYQEFFDKFNTSGFTKFRNKYIVYSSSADVVRDLKLYFIASSNFK